MRKAEFITLENFQMAAFKNNFLSLKSLQKYSTPTWKRNFTLLELLLVVAVIAILLSMLLPSLMAAREKAHFAACTSNRNQNYTMIINGTSDNSGIYPLWFSGKTHNILGDWYKTNEIEPDYKREDWMGTVRWGLDKRNGGPNTSIVNPVAGLYSGHTEWTYTVDEVVAAGKHPLSDTLRCPSIDEGPRQVGSNGAFDYSFVQAVRGQAMPKFNNTVTWYGEEMAAPLIVEEDPASNINYNNRETAWGNGDRIGTWHDFGKKGSYTATDGSIVIIRIGKRYDGNSEPMMDMGSELKSWRNVNTGGGVGEINISLEGNEIYRW